MVCALTAALVKVLPTELSRVFCWYRATPIHAPASACRVLTWFWVVKSLIPLMIMPASVGTSANLKGYACEYMTSGRVVILGDPGPWAFSGMTGGVVYQLLTPEMGFTLDVLERRLGIGAQVNILPVEGPDICSIQELLAHYHQALLQTNQPEYAEQINQFCLPQVALSRFVKIVPRQITPVE